MNDVIMADDGEDAHDDIVDGWTSILTRGGKIFWNDLFEKDIASRRDDASAVHPGATDLPVPRAAPHDDAPHDAPHGASSSRPPSDFDVLDLRFLIQDEFRKLNEKVDLLEKKFENLQKELNTRGEKEHNTHEDSPRQTWDSPLQPVFFPDDVPTGVTAIDPEGGTSSPEDLPTEGTTTPAGNTNPPDDLPSKGNTSPTEVTTTPAGTTDPPEDLPSGGNTSPIGGTTPPAAIDPESHSFMGAYGSFRRC